MSMESLLLTLYFAIPFISAGSSWPYDQLEYVGYQDSCRSYCSKNGTLVETQYCSSTKRYCCGTTKDKYCCSSGIDALIWDYPAATGSCDPGSALRTIGLSFLITILLVTIASVGILYIKGYCRCLHKCNKETRVANGTVEVARQLSLERPNVETAGNTEMVQQPPCYESHVGDSDMARPPPYYSATDAPPKYNDIFCIDVEAVSNGVTYDVVSRGVVIPESTGHQHITSSLFIESVHEP